MKPLILLHTPSRGGGPEEGCANRNYVRKIGEDLTKSIDWGGGVQIEKFVANWQKNPKNKQQRRFFF